MPGRSSNSANPTDNYKFTGHERDTEANLTLDYMMARNYDPIIGRFLQIDPMYEVYPGWSPYTYTLNNPLLYIDPTGQTVQCTSGDDCPEWFIKLRGIDLGDLASGIAKTYDQAKELTQKELVEIIQEVIDNGEDPSAGVFEALEQFENVSISGDVLRGTLEELEVSVDKKFVPIIDGIDSISKEGEQILINSQKNTKTKVEGIPVLGTINLKLQSKIEAKFYSEYNEVGFKNIKGAKAGPVGIRSLKYQKNKNGSNSVIVNIGGKLANKNIELWNSN